METTISSAAAKPILFSVPMVVATRLRRKNLTSRLTGLDKINTSPDSWELFQLKALNGYTLAVFKSVNGEQVGIECPYGGVGTELWVRENWYVKNDLNGLKPIDLPFDDPSMVIGWMADGPKWKGAGKTRPAIHMPERIARLILQVEEIKVERLTEISETDAWREGVEKSRWIDVPDEAMEEKIVPTYYDGFRRIFIELNGAEAWEQNSWVWRVSYNLKSDKSKQ